MKKYTGFEIYFCINRVLDEISKWEEARSWARSQLGESSDRYKQCQEELDRLNNELKKFSGKKIFIEDKDLQNK